MQLLVQQVLLECRRDRGLIGTSNAGSLRLLAAAHLATGAETGQPDGGALLADELRSLFIRDGAYEAISAEQEDASCVRTGVESNVGGHSVELCIGNEALPG